MRILGVDSSAKAASVCILDHGSVITHLFQNSGLTHSETLVPMIRQALAESGFTLDEIDALAVTIGPGSFTGAADRTRSGEGNCAGSQ